MIPKAASVYAQSSNFGRYIDVVIRAEAANGDVIHGLPVQLATSHDSDLYEPAMRMSHQQGQQLMDQLWNCGLRPTEGSGSAGSLAATQAHLKDMQAIAFGALKKVQAIE